MNNSRVSTPFTNILCGGNKIIRPKFIKTLKAIQDSKSGKDAVLNVGKF
jgi:hypothetical protein